MGCGGGRCVPRHSQLKVSDAVSADGSSPVSGPEAISYTKLSVLSQKHS